MPATDLQMKKESTEAEHNKQVRGRMKTAIEHKYRPWAETAGYTANGTQNEQQLRKHEGEANILKSSANTKSLMTLRRSSVRLRLVVGSSDMSSRFLTCNATSGIPAKRISKMIGTTNVILLQHTTYRSSAKQHFVHPGRSSYRSLSYYQAATESEWKKQE